MKFLYSSLVAAFALATGALALPGTSNSASSSPQVQVNLEMAGNTNVKISIKNTGSEPLRLVKVDGLLSDLAVNKVTVVKDSRSLPMHGGADTNAFYRQQAPFLRYPR